MNPFASISLVLGVAGLVCGTQIPPPREVANVAALVEQLGSEDFLEREDALRKLSALRVVEPPAELLAALKSNNPEVRERAAKAINALRQRFVLSRLTRGEKFAKRGQIDLFIASTATSPWKADDDRLWISAFDVGTTAVVKAELKGERLPHGGPTWAKDFPTYRSRHRNGLIRTDGVFARDENAYPIFYGAIHAAGVDEPQSLQALILSRGTVCSKGAIRRSLVLATGDVRAGNGMSDTVVICDGEVTVRGDVTRCLIIAREKIDIVGHSTSCTLFAGKTIKPGLLPPQQRHPLPIPPGTDPAMIKAILATNRSFWVETLQNERRPLGYITFFELSTVGVGVKAEGKSLHVTTIADGKPIADAGVKVGDIITAVNGKKPDSAESLRRLLRDALAVGDATVQLQRGGKTVTVKVSLPE